MMTESRQRATERRKGRKNVKSDVDALKCDGEALIGAADVLNGDVSVLKDDGKALL